MLAGSPFIGEGYRKAWARLRLAGVRTSKGRVLRLMREAGLLAPTRVGRRRGPRNHDGTITTGHPDEMWGTDATACLTTGTVRTFSTTYGSPGQKAISLTACNEDACISATRTVSTGQ